MSADDNAAAVDLQAWWEPFHEPSLDRVVAEVVRSNLDVQQAVARLSAARAMARASGTTYRPEAHVAAAPESTPDARQSFYEAGLAATWPLGLFGSDAATQRAASADTALAQVDVQSVHATVVAETVRTYIEWRAARAIAANVDAQIEAQDQRTQLTQTRLRLHLSADQDVAVERAHAVELQSRRLALDRAMNEAAETLGLLLASSDAAKAENLASGSVPTFAPLRVEQVPANLVRTRADIRRAEQSVLKAGAELDRARADLYPRLTLGGSITLALPMGSTAGGAHAGVSGGPAIEIPLFDWGRRRARVDAQDAMLDAALIAYRSSVLTAVHDVETALCNLEIARKETELRHTQAAEAARAEERARAGLQLRRAGNLDVLIARSAALEQSAALLEAQQAYALAYVALFQALGGASLSAVAS